VLNYFILHLALVPSIERLRNISYSLITVRCSFLVYTALTEMKPHMDLLVKQVPVLH